MPVPLEALLIDLDGVIYQGDTAIEGAGEVIDWLAREDIPHLFLTNTSSRPIRAICAKLANLQIHVAAEQIMTPAVAARAWIARHRCQAAALFVPAPTMEDFTGVATLDTTVESGADAVVVGDLGTSWTFERLNQAFRLLMQAPAPALLALGMTRYWRSPRGLQLDVGPFVAALEHASGRQALVMGKPARHFYAQALNRLQQAAEHCVMIGDDIRGDVGGAQAAGLSGVLVKTGKYRVGDLDDEIRPVATLDSIAELPDWWQQQQA